MLTIIQEGCVAYLYVYTCDVPVSVEILLAIIPVRVLYTVVKQVMGR